ncbi:MAG TPA: hypothetical protein VEU62_12585, partial [Bryobacterales bacterium]|nr:hypothetical protein [Bryobacterales bacterium]
MTRPTLQILLLAAALLAPARAQSTHHPGPLNPHDFALMAWGGSPSDPDQLLGMEEAGLNISGFCHPEDLDRVHNAGLTCFVTDKLINGYDWLHLPSDEELRANVVELKSKIDSKPAAIGFFLRDEPPVAMMPGLGRVASLLH